MHWLFPARVLAANTIAVQGITAVSRDAGKQRGMMTDVLTYRGAIYPWHCDHMGHMNVTWYVGKFDEATWHLFAQIGMTPSYLREGGRGMAAVQQNISYKRELLAGDIVEIRSRIIGLREKVPRFAHDMINAETGESAASCELTAVHLDRAARRSIAFEDRVRGLAQKLLG
jgi:acyl-CoA thioester hydrolase